MAYSQQLWDEAKRKFKLGEEEIRMAKEMRFNPKSHKRAGDPSERVRKRQGGAEERTDIYSDDGGYRGR